MMANSTLVSLAILKVNFDLGKTYLDNFVPIVAECIRISEDDIVSLPVLQENLRSNFGLRIPQKVIEAILKRVKKGGFVYLEDRVYKRNNGVLNKLNFNKFSQRVLVEHNALVNSLMSFCSSNYAVNWALDEAETALQQYIEENQLIIGDPSKYSAIISDGKHPAKSVKYIIGSFIKFIYDNHLPECDYFETVIKGNMLANAVFLPDPNKASNKFRRTEVYFDTSFLLYALGYAGSSRKAPCVELLQLLYETGASLRCFQHTLIEMRGALDACSNRIARGQLRDAYGPSIEYFLAHGFTASDIELISSRIETDLDKLHISIVEKPVYIELKEHLINEKALEELLSASIKYRHPIALTRDVDSISAIMRIRAGKECISIEECKAIFVTTNIDLFRSSCEFFYQTASSVAFAPCTTDYSLTNLLWLKKPSAAPDLPKKRIIADCYAAIQPSEQLWRKYITEIDRLEQNKGTSSDDVYLLRYSSEAKSGLMSFTLGEEEAFTAGTIKEILEYVHERLQSKLRSDLERAKKEIEESRNREVNLISRIEDKANRFSRMISETIKYSMLTLLLISIITTFPWKLPSLQMSLDRYILSFVQIAGLIIILINYMVGTFIISFTRKLEIFLYNWKCNRLRRIFGINN